MTQETYDLLEGELQRRASDLADSEIGSEEDKRKMDMVIKLIEKVNESDKVSCDFQDKCRRNSIEEEKNKITWQKVTLDMAKVIIPALLGYAAYDRFQMRVMKYEETGKVCSTAGRELHLPNFLRK